MERSIATAKDLHQSKQEHIKRGERVCNCTSWLWSGESVALCLNILFTVDHSLTARCSSGYHASITALTTDRWLANHELHSELLEVLHHCSTSTADGLHSKFRHTDKFLPRTRTPLVTCSSSLCALEANHIEGVSLSEVHDHCTDCFFLSCTKAITAVAAATGVAAIFIDVTTVCVYIDTLSLEHTYNS